MSKIDVVRAAMVEAMKAKDKARKDSLSMLLSALKNAQIDNNQNASEYYKGDENKLAVYATHDWDVTPNRAAALHGETGMLPHDLLDALGPLFAENGR